MPGDGLSVSKLIKVQIMAKRLMTDDDVVFGLFLQEVLDRDTTSYDDKLAIIKWFDSFDYLTGNETVMDGILRCAENLNW